MGRVKITNTGVRTYSHAQFYWYKGQSEKADKMALLHISIGHITRSEYLSSQFR